MKRSKSSIIDRASKLNIQYYKRWSTLEDDILITYYSDEGMNISKRLPDRTSSSIQGRVKKLGLKSNLAHHWTIDEDNIIRQYYSIEGGDVYKRLNGITKHQCMQHANFLGLSANTLNSSAQKWTEEEDDIIKKYYLIEGGDCYKRLKNRKRQNVIGRASQLGVHIRQFGKGKVVCIETGMIFENASRARRYYGNAHVNECLNGTNDYAGKLPDGTKLHWKYVEEEEEEKNE